MRQSLAESSGVLQGLGLDPAGSGTPELQWANRPESWGVFVVAAAVIAVAAGVLWLYRHELAACPRWAKRLLAALRLTVLLLLGVMLLRPVVTFKQVRITKPTIAVLRDASLSFDHRDRYRDPQRIAALAAAADVDPVELRDGVWSRAALVDRLWSTSGSRPFQALRERGSLRVIDFSDTARTVALIPATPGDAPPPSDPGPAVEGQAATAAMPPLTAQGRTTDIGQALNDVLNDSDRLAAIVLISDGQHQGPQDPIALAARAATLGIPILTVPVGDPSRPTNLAISDVFVRATARPDEPFEIESVLYAQDAGVARAQVELLQLPVDPRTGQPGEGVPVETRDVALPESGGRQRIDFQHTVRQSGRYVYQLRVRPVDGEIDLQDNQRLSNPVEVVDEKIRVLLISGGPSWDYQLVQRLLQRDANIQLTCWLQTVDEGGTQAGDERISRLPRTIEELGRYNVILLMDPNPDEFDEAWIDSLKLFCRRKAGGLLFVAGPKYTADFITLQQLRGIRDLLPVRFTGDEIIESTQLLQNLSVRPGKMLVREQYLDHPILTFVADPAENRAIWEEMPNVFWSFPALAAKPIAQTLLEHGDVVNVEGNQPLLVAGRYGAGSVVYMGFSSTWRWRRVGLQAQYFDRFWIQLTHFLNETRSLSGNRRGTLDVDRTEFQLGDPVALVARVLDERFEPLQEPALRAIVRGEEQWMQELELRRLPGDEGVYEGSFTAQRTGVFQAEVVLPAGEEGSLIEPVSFRIVPPGAETLALWLNEKLLRDIARTSGGETFTLDQMPALIEALPKLATKTEINSPPVPLWDLSPLLRWAWFTLPVLLLAAEWIVRKRTRLL